MGAGAIGRTLVAAVAAGSLTLLIIVVCGGFVLDRDQAKGLLSISLCGSKGVECRLAQVHPWVIWCYWASPLMYAQQALSISEFSARDPFLSYSAILWQLLVLSLDKLLFRTARWQKPNPENPGELLGPAVLHSRGFFTEHWFVWLSIGALAAYALLFNALILLAMSYFKRLALCGHLWLTLRSMHLKAVVWCSPWGCGGAASGGGVE